MKGSIQEDKVMTEETLAMMNQLQIEATLPSLLFVTRKLGEVEESKESEFA